MNLNTSERIVTGTVM